MRIAISSANKDLDANLDPCFGRAVFPSLAEDKVLCDADADAAAKDIACLGRIPFDPIFTEAMIQAQTLYEYNTGSKAEKAVADIWQHLCAE